jgi:hypothetical protein
MHLQGLKLPLQPLLGLGQLLARGGHRDNYFQNGNVQYDTNVSCDVG